MPGVRLHRSVWYVLAQVATENSVGNVVPEPDDTCQPNGTKRSPNIDPCLSFEQKSTKFKNENGKVMISIVIKRAGQPAL